MNLEEVQLKLLAEVQLLPSELALEFCRKALKEIINEYNWSFLWKRDFIRTPKMITDGSVNVAQFSSSVIVSTGLKTVLDAITVNQVPLIGRQFRTFGGQIAGSNFIYTITGYNSGTSILTISPFYQDASNSAARFQIFKNLYLAPEPSDFDYFEFIYSPFSQRRLWLDRTRAELDNKDFTRQSMGDPIWAVSSGTDTNGNQLFELYPIPTNERVYQVLYKKSGLFLEPDDDIPKAFDYGLIIAKAKIKAYEWLMGNRDLVKYSSSPNIYASMIAMLSNPNMENSYSRLLESAKIGDENLYPQQIIDLGSMPYYEDRIVETILMDF